MLMSRHDLKVGGAYFQITFSDREFTIPGVDPMIYIGVDVLEPDPSSEPPDKPQFVFQDTVSFSRFGSAVDYKGGANLTDEDARVYSLTPEDLEYVYDLSGVVEELTQALKRAREIRR
jgi:hypothetical protein